MNQTHVSDHPTTAESSVRQLRALRLMIVVLIPIAIWTVVGLVWLWPHHVSDHIREDVSQYSVKGLTLPNGEITQVRRVSCQGEAGSVPGDPDQDACGVIKVRLLDGPDTGRQVDVTLTQAQFRSGVDPGQKVKLFRVPTGDRASYQFADFDRTLPLIALAAIFALAVIVVARWRGFASLIGLAFAGFILIEFIFPALVSGENPLLVALIGSSAIMFVVLYAAHGFSARTTTALIGTLFGLLLTAGIGWSVGKWAHLTGVATEDDYLLSASAPDMALTSVVLCGIIVAGLGVLNDVTITQASAVWELAESDPDQKRLFTQAMRIGRDHIASSVYTIAFATAGAGLSALLLITVYGRPLAEVAQTEALSEEIIRTLTGAIGLVLAMPLTTIIGVAVVRAGRLGRSRTTSRSDTVAGGGSPATPNRRPTPAGRSGAGRPADPRPVRPTAATTAPFDDRETTPLPKIRRATEDAPQVRAGDAVGGAHEPAGERAGGPAEEPADGAGDAVPAAAERPRRRSRRGHQGDDESFNFADLRDQDDDDRPRGRRWR